MDQPLALTEVARLDVAAASGLVEMDGRLHLVADDENALFLFDSSGRALDRIPLFGGELPDEPRARKAHKPDLEALTQLGPGTLLALGSGSTQARCRGALVRGRAVTPVELAPLYEALARELPELNIEGAATAGDRLVLLQRGNGAAGVNAIVELDLDGVRRAIDEGRPLDATLLRAVRPIALGSIDGVPLGFTDATPLGDGRILFAAAAESGGSTYEDGAALGSALGLLDGGHVRGLVRLATRDKIEGVHANRAGDRVSLWMVADGDDRAVRAPLYAAALSLAAFES